MARSNKKGTAADKAHIDDATSEAITRKAGVSQLRREAVSSTKSTPKNKPSNSVRHKSREPARPSMAEFYGQSLAKLLTFPEYWGDHFVSTVEYVDPWETWSCDSIYWIGNQSLQSFMDVISGRAPCRLDNLFRPKFKPDMLPANKNLMPEVSKAFLRALDVPAVMYAASSVLMSGDLMSMKDTYVDKSEARNRLAVYHGQFLARVMAYPEFWEYMPQKDDLFLLLSERVTTEEINKLFTFDLNELVHFDCFITQILGAQPFYFASDDTCDEYARGFMEALDKDSVLRAVAAASKTTKPKKK
jgi:hypothetical protein